MKNLVLSWDNKLLAWRKVRKNHSKSKAVIRFEKDLALNLWRHQEDLRKTTWRPGPNRMFIVHEPKERLIAAPDLSNRIAQQQWVNVYGPIFDEQFIDHSYACREGKGMLRACLDLQQAMQNLPRCQTWYVARLDFRKYFHSVDHGVLLDIVNRTVADDWSRWLFRVIIESYYPGIPIGSLTSQFAGNVVLNEVDQLAMNLSIKKYGRYMDDIYYLGNDRDRLEDQMYTLALFAESKLKLSVNGNKCQVVEFKRPYEKPQAIDFCGYRVLPDKIYVRKSTLARAGRRINAILEWAQDPAFLGAQLCSVNGLLAHADRDSYTRMVERRVMLPAYDRQHQLVSQSSSQDFAK